jgi:hypothetical protein
MQTNNPSHKSGSGIQVRGLPKSEKARVRNFVAKTQSLTVQHIDGALYYSHYIASIRGRISTEEALNSWALT